MDSNFQQVSMKAMEKTIISYLQPRDVLNLSMVSRDFNNIFDSNDVWKMMFDRYFEIQIPIDSDLRDIDWKMSCVSMVQQSPSDLNLHKKFCISKDCHFKKDADAVLCLKPSKAHMNLLEWSFNSVENQFESSSDSETMDTVCVEDLHCPSPTDSYHSASSVQYENQGSTTNLLVTSSVSTSSIIEKPEVKEGSIQIVSSPFKFTRQALQQRLQNLVNCSLKKFNGDPELSLPGNLTKKFILRYRID